MGNTPYSDFDSQFKQNYGFIQILDDPNFGMVKIYRKKQINFDYVMMYDQSLVGWNTAQRNKKLSELQLVRDQPHQQVLRLFYFQQIQKNSFQCKVDVIRMYIEYYNFTLQNLIENNARGKIFLDYDEILYIINSIISVYLYFQSIQAHWFRIHPSQIFISTQGSVYFSPTQLCRSRGDEFNGCVVNSSVNQQKPTSLKADDPKKSFQKLKQLMYNLIQHHSLASFQQCHILQRIFDSVNTINMLSTKMPKTSRTQIDMQKQIYRQQHSNKNSPASTTNLSQSSTNRSLTFKEQKHSLKGIRRDLYR